MKILALCSLLVSFCYAHMCMLNPYQRDGPVDAINTVGASACGLTTPPCGGTSPDEVIKEIVSDNNQWAFVMQKNLNHFNSANPGNFTVNVLNAQMTFVDHIGSVPDTNLTSLSFYQLYTKIPTNLLAGDHYIIQAIYFTNHGNNYYQCSDVLAI